MKSIPYKAPDFSLPNANGEQVSLGDFSSKWLVMFFYPKDFTPGCTTEACSLRDIYDTLRARNVDVVGVSRDSSKSHAGFAEKHTLTYNLLSDQEGKVVEAYEAWGPSVFGKKSVGRKTFIINPDGLVVKEYPKVTPASHGQQLLRDIDGLQFAAGAYGAGNF
jgi:thioredoxin-dependent peroxiredoxin